MISDLGLVFLTAVACFQLALSADSVAITYDDLKDRQPSDALQRSYLANRLIEAPTAVLARYYNDGV